MTDKEEKEVKVTKGCLGCAMSILYILFGAISTYIMMRLGWIS